VFYAASTGQGTARQVGRSLAEVEQALQQLVWTLAAISLAAVALAVMMGRLVAATNFHMPGVAAVPNSRYSR
jgi:hypothetical protein